MKKKTILIAGCGNLGSRYLQGLSCLSTPLEIFLFDINKSAITNAINFFDINKNHKINICENISAIPSKLNLVINATTAFNRCEIIKLISNLSDVDYWILEKVLEQNTKNLRLIQIYLRSSKGVWVNTPRRAMPWYSEIKSKIPFNLPLHFTYTGGSWGLACNALHFIDLLSWFTSERVVSLNNSLLEKNWVQAKRNGFYEIFGTLIVNFSKGSILELKSMNTDLRESLIEIQDSKGILTINEKAGFAKHTNGTVINGNILFQSEITSTLVNEILFKGSCKLPDLYTAIEMHEKFLECMLSHWNKNMPYNTEIIPIT